MADRKQWKQWQTLFWGAPRSLQMVTAAMKLKDACFLKEKLWPTLKSRHITLPTKVCLVKASFSSSHVRMSELDYKESWAPKNWCFWTVVLEKTLESPLDCKEVQPVHPKRNQSWIFTGRTDAETEIPILWLPDGKNWLLGKDRDSGKDLRQEEEGVTEDEMVGWHHQLDRHEIEQSPGAGDAQGSLACCSPWVTKSRTWLSNWSDGPKEENACCKGVY